jgi:myosin-5
VLSLIEGKFGLIKQLNEECVRPKGNDEAFVSKALQSNKTIPCLIVKNTFARDEFGIHHFAGPVIYKAKDFVTRNTDTLPSDLQLCAKACSNEIIAKHLDNEKCSNQAVDAVEVAKTAPKRAKSSLAADTVLTKFKSQLGSLMTGLATTSSRYIRCVKPNTLKKKLVMQHVTTMEQLRCAGVIAAVTISRSAFPNRLDMPEVKEKFKNLYQGKRPKYADLKAEIADLLEQTLKHLETKKKNGTVAKAYAIGNTRAYFGAGSLEFLEQERSKVWDRVAVKIQRIARGYLTKRMILMQKYAQFNEAVVPIQTFVRMVLAKRRYKVKKEEVEQQKREAKELADQLERDKEKIVAAITVQSLFRIGLAKNVVEVQKREMKRMKRMGKKSKKAAVRIQAIARGFIQRPKYKAALVRQKEDADLQNQLGKMEEKLKDAEDQRKTDIEDAKFKFEQEMEEYKEQLEDKLRTEAGKQNQSLNSRLLSMSLERSLNTYERRT